MRAELAVGQFADLINDAGAFPTLDQVLNVSRRKSGNYTVRRPLEIGATMAGCNKRVLASLATYGEAVGDAFQLRDDVLGIFGSPTVTGKPAGGDLSERKATSVVVTAYQLAEPGLRKQLKELMSRDDLDESDIVRWRNLILATGAVERIEQMIDSRLNRALDWIDAAPIDRTVRTTLASMATACAERAA
jgi:geranylgeranyl diphosphate synthase type I